MAEITRKRIGELLRKIFQILSKQPEGLQASKLLDRMASELTLTAHEAGFYKSGARRFEKIVRFGTIGAVKAGWLIKNKGIWTITEDGLKAYKEFSDPEALAREADRLYRIWKAAQRGEPSKAPNTDTDLDDERTEESAAVTYEEAEEQAWAQIEDYLRKMPPFDFQELVASLLEAMDYYVNWISPPGKDGGVDIIAFTDPLGTKAPRIKVQVKRLSERVSTDLLKSFIATINENDAGLYVSTGGFTRDAAELARNQERRKITLIDLRALVELWIAHQDELADEARRRLPLTPIYFLTPET